MKPSLTKNFILNLIYQMIIIIVPIILIPYLSRTLLDSGTGVYAYNHSWVVYFSLMAMFGVQIYGNKKIAESNEGIALKKTFWEIFLLKGITTVVSSLVYFIIIWFIKGDFVLLLFNFIFLLSNFLDISWFFSGKEQFQPIVIRNIVVRLISVVLIFLFVKKPDDIYIYSAIMALSTLFGNLVMWFDIFKYGLLDFKNNKIRVMPFSHFVDMLILFIPFCLNQRWPLSNIILGWFSSDAEVGYFDMSIKIINTLLAITAALSLVVLPRISKLHNDKDHNKIVEILIKSFSILSYLSFPMMIGILVLADKIVPWFLGNDFLPAITVLRILSLTLILEALMNVIGLQYMVPTSKSKQYTISVVVGFALFVVLSVLLVTHLNALGAAVALLITGMVIVTMQVFFVRKDFPFIQLIKPIGKIIISSLIMGGILLILKDLFYIEISEYFKNIAFEMSWFIKEGFIILIYITIGGLIYFISELILRDKINSDILHKLRLFKK